jgi:hypothetical protein
VCRRRWEKPRLPVLQARESARDYSCVWLVYWPYQISWTKNTHRKLVQHCAWALTGHHTHRDSISRPFFLKKTCAHIFLSTKPQEKERERACWCRRDVSHAVSLVQLILFFFFFFSGGSHSRPGPQWRGIRGDARKNKARSHGTASSSGTHGFTDSLDRLDRHPGKGIEKAISHWSSSILYVYARSLRQQHSDN